MTAALCVPLVVSTAMVAAGQNGYYQNDRGNNEYRQSHQQFNSGAYEGGRGGEYGNEHDRRYDEYDRQYHGNGNYYGDPRYRHDNGIGPGKGALIGGAGGAALGAVFGGGAKGAIIGGAAGAGIGAVLGQHAQTERREREY